MKYILCELNDENYTMPSFSFHDSYLKAQEKAIDDIIDSFKYEKGTDLKLETERPESEKIIKGTRISGEWNERDNFFVTEIFSIDSTNGEYLLIWHHAYEGVGFKIVFQGTYEECLTKKIKQMKELLEYVQENGDNSDFDIEESDCIDTGNEWEMWSIVEIPKQLN